MTVNIPFRPACSALFALAGAFVGHARTIRYTGVSLAGAEFDQGSLPGTYSQHYTYPAQAA